MTRATLSFVVVIAGLLAATPAADAQAGSPLSSFTARMVDAGGQPFNRAGASPDRVELNLTFDPAAANGKDLSIDLPPGFAGDTQAVTVCRRELLSVLNPDGCPSASQVGVVTVGTAFDPAVTGIYNVESDRDSLMLLGFKTFGISGRMSIRALPDGRSRLEVENLGQDLTILTLAIELWGVPADHQTAPAGERHGLFVTPTRCDGRPLTIGVQVNSWQQPDVWHGTSAELAPPLAGCDTIELAPRLELALGSTRTDSPTGMEVVVAVPQSDDPDGQVTGRAKDIGIRLPEDVVLSPGAANGLTACPEQDVGLGRTAATRCPAASRIGTAELSSPLLRDPVQGAIHLGRQQSRTDFRMYVVVARGTALDMKLAGVLHADPSTGRLTAVLPDLPEIPFERFALRFPGGARAPFATPLACGRGSGAVAVVPFSGGPSIEARSDVAIDADPLGRPCPARPPFAPTLVAGTEVVRAGAAAPFAVTIRRAPGEQLLDRIAVTLPEGISARLASVRPCAATAAAAGACPRASRIGAAIAEAGSGSRPFALEGDAFLTDSHRRAPFGMALVFRGVVGAFDIGTVVVRAALRVDPRSGRLTVATDPLPRIVNGIPLRLQTLALDLDRPGFVFNPTSCAPSRVSASLSSIDGAVSQSSSRFAVGGCRRLRFRPAFSAILTDRSELHAGGRPGLRLGLRTSSGGANVRSFDVVLPRLLVPSQTGTAAICSLAQLEDDRCPAAARLGGVAARTPMLSKPLRGSIYMVQPPGGGLADVWAVMRGSGVTVRFRMKTAVKDGRVHGTVAALPDMPLSRVTFSFASGERGLFTLSARPCVGGRARRMLAVTRVTAHSAAKRRAALRVRVGPSC